MSELVDVVVVGAGPAGIAAAITARRARAARSCASTRRTFPRDKTCGDGLTANALRLLEALGLTRDDFAATEPAFVRETVLVSPSGRRGHAPAARPTALHAAVVDRRDLDAALVALARRRGVDVREGVRGREGRDRRRRACELTLDDGSTLRRPSRDRGRRALVDRPARARTRRAARSRRVARGAPVLRRRRRRPALGALRARPPARLRVGVPAARRRRQRRLRRAARPTAAADASSRTLWPELLARPVLRDILGPNARADRAGARVADPDALRPGPARARPRAVRGRRGGRRRPDDGRGHRAGDRDRACSRPRRSRPAPTTPGSCTARSAATCGSRACSQRVLRHPLGRAGRDPRRRPHAVDPPQLRPLDVGGLSACAARHARPLAPRHAHGTAGAWHDAPPTSR